MKQRSFLIAGLIVCAAWTYAWCDDAAATISDGVKAYQEERWMTALGDFVEILARDPSNEKAHAYVRLILQKLEVRQVSRAHEDQLAILNATSRLLENRQLDSGIVDEALRRTTADEADRQKATWHAECNMAQMEAQLGHLATANDIVLRVITENPNDPEAQRLLSQLQTQIRESLNSKMDLSLAERHALEGFYAYGQADYASATAAWSQARVALEQVSAGTETTHQVSLLHFDTYDQKAKAKLEEERQIAKAKELFDQGMAAYEEQHFDKSLENFRQVALINPEYAQLGFYLVKSEAAVERERTRDLSDDKRQKAAASFAKGMASMEKGKYADAQTSFQEVLALDPAHPQARLYLQQIAAQKNKHIDPEAAEQHFESGLIAYAAGQGESAIREWNIALRLDPDNSKISDAVNKAQRELVMSKELP